jgi:ribosome-associated protein
LGARKQADSIEESRTAAYLAANTAEDKKGRGCLILDVGKVTLLADYFVIVGGESLVQVRAIAQAIEEKLSESGFVARSVEGKVDGRWVLLDFGFLIVHVLHERERDFYKLEQFWNQALIVNRDQWACDEQGLAAYENRLRKVQR